MKTPEPLKGRGASWNPPNRFEPIEYIADEENAEPASSVVTRYFRDPSRTIIARNDSPDVGFEASINPYRGCEHGCIYCFARPTHEYLGFSAGLDFETRILVKEDAPELLRAELSSRRWAPQVIAVSGVTDPYQPIERKTELTRRCLGVLAEFRNPVAMITKNQLITRDRDHLAALARVGAASVCISLTTLDDRLAGIMEPRTSRPSLRLEAVASLSAAGVPVGVLIAPVIPAINDHEIPAILSAAADAGASFAGYVLLRLPHAVAPLFERWLEEHFSDRSRKVLDRLRSTRAGKLYDSRWRVRQRGEGFFAEQVSLLFETAARRAGIDGGHPELSTAAFRRPNESEQGSLFQG
ncbi:MAG TPA: PA0069 family radical SAM protein [Thermoanaerobaculia bacterium]|nr:PA0069 family radical SAM protein [Thermoanaerobaculia bacterium]